MMPFQQGALDSLCGIYSLINAESLVNDTKIDDSQILFNETMEFLEKEQILASILTDGMLLKQMQLVLNDVIGARIQNKTLPYCGIANPALGEFWSEVLSFLNESPRRAVILGLSGVHDHWTIIKEISDKQIKLFDSSGIKSINRRFCTTSDATDRRKHVLWPAQTFFLSN